MPWQACKCVHLVYVQVRCRELTVLTVSIEDFYRLYPSNSLPDYVRVSPRLRTISTPHDSIHPGREGQGVPDHGCSKGLWVSSRSGTLRVGRHDRLTLLSCRQYEHLLNRLPTANPPAFVEGPHVILASCHLRALAHAWFSSRASPSTSSSPTSRPSRRSRRPRSTARRA
jgi:hypothetical protein